jgi:hypothetical protein
LFINEAHWLSMKIVSTKNPCKKELRTHQVA